MSTDKKPEMVKVEILEGNFHRHKGRDYVAGAQFTLTRDQAEWLVAQKKVKEIK